DAGQQSSLYVFEGIEEGSEYLARVCSAATDCPDVWRQELCPGTPKGANHHWLWDHLRTLPSLLPVDPELGLAEGLGHCLVGTLSGETLGQNRLREPIARGGFGTIYSAEDQARKQVAVKVMEVREGLDTEEDRSLRSADRVI